MKHKDINKKYLQRYFIFALSHFFVDIFDIPKFIYRLSSELFL